MSDALRKRTLLGNAPPPYPSYRFAPGAEGRRHLIRKKDYTPVSWDKYFDSKRDVASSDGRVYECGTEGPVLLLLHGGGFSALSWALFSKALTHIVTCRCVAVDMRGHGDTHTTDDTDLSAERLTSDVGNIVNTLYGDDPPEIILIGHSMGGAIAVQTAYKELIPSLIGLIVIDVVEGSALEALKSMQRLLQTRPTQFKSLELAIEWCVRSGHVRNLESAKVSMVGQIVRTDTNELGSTEVEREQHLHEENSGTTADNCDIIKEECENGEEPVCTKSPSSDILERQPSHMYVWRIDLSKTEQFWVGWFQGLSKMFLSCGVPKMLVLAAMDRLDKDLTIGQMQGKFQIQVLPQVGHAVHEDSPDKLADVLASFMVRHKFVEPTSNFSPTFPAC